MASMSHYFHSLAESISPCSVYHKTVSSEVRMKITHLVGYLTSLLIGAQSISLDGSNLLCSVYNETASSEAEMTLQFPGDSRKWIPANVTRDDTIALIDAVSSSGILFQLDLEDDGHLTFMLDGSEINDDTDFGNTPQEKRIFEIIEQMGYNGHYYLQYDNNERPYSESHSSQDVPLDWMPKPVWNACEMDDG